MSQQLTTHSLSELRNILRILWSDPTLPAALLIGPPGCGKSTMIADLAHEMDMPCYTMMANLCEPTDFGGLPFISDGVVNMAPLAWARRIAGTRCVLNLDEINTARPATISTLLRVVLDHMVGELHLGSELRIVAAMNLAEEAANGWELPPALANRFQHFVVSETRVADFVRWALEQPATAASDTLRNLLLKFSTETMHNPATSGPFGSPRSWWSGLRAVATAIDSGHPQLAQSLLAASVGVGNALAWSSGFNADAVDWTLPQPPATVRKVILKQIEAVKTGAATAETLWPLLERAANNNIAATYSTVGSQREYLQTIAITPKAMHVFQMIADAAKTQGHGGGGTPMVRP